LVDMAGSIQFSVFTIDTIRPARRQTNLPSYPRQPPAGPMTHR